MNDSLFDHDTTGSFHAIERREHKKHTDYPGAGLYPFVVDTRGRWGKEAHAFIHLAVRSLEPADRTKAIHECKQMVSRALLSTTADQMLSSAHTTISPPGSTTITTNPPRSAAAAASAGAHTTPHLARTAGANNTISPATVHNTNQPPVLTDLANIIQLPPEHYAPPPATANADAAPHSIHPLQHARHPNPSHLGRPPVGQSLPSHPQVYLSCAHLACMLTGSTTPQHDEHGICQGCNQPLRLSPATPPTTSPLSHQPLQARSPQPLIQTF